MKVLIHAGLPKTGSSTIQATFENNREKLRRGGILYPKFNGDGEIAGHWQLAALWYDNIDADVQKGLLNRLQKCGGRDLIPHVTETLAADFERAKAEGLDVVLSYEHLGDPAPIAGLRNLKAFIDTYASDISVFAYIRHPFELFPSSVQQHLKSLDGSLIRLFAERMLSIDSTIAVFGRERVTLRLYAPRLFRGGGLVEDLCAWIADKTDREPISLDWLPPRNESLNAVSCGVLAYLRRMLDGSPDDIRAYNQTRQLLMEFSDRRPSRKLVLPQNWQPVLDGWVGKSWNGLLERAENDELEKAPFRLPASGPPGGLDEDAVRNWLEAGYDHEFTQEFLDHCRRSTRQYARRVVNCVERLLEFVRSSHR